MRNVASAIAWLVIVVGAGACGPKSSNGDDGDDGDDGGNPDAADVTFPDAPACVSEAVDATEAVRPVDILWVIDNSGSMDLEEQRVQDNMNAFAASIGTNGIDYHVIVISDTGHISVPPPLNPSAHYLGVNVSIGSTDALEKLVQYYPMYQSFLRPLSVKHIVVVTDDESNWSQATFEQQLAALTGPGFGSDWRFHAIVAEAPPWDITNHCFALAADIGQTYIDLQNAHNGVFFSLCDTNWSPLFTTLSEQVSQGLELPCTYAIPAPPMGQVLDPTRVNFVHTPPMGAPVTIPNVGSAAGCTGNGWYYDDPVNPTVIIVCPQTCSTLQTVGGEVDVAFGCGTIIE